MAALRNTSSALPVLIIYRCSALASVACDTMTDWIQASRLQGPMSRELRQRVWELSAWGSVPITISETRRNCVQMHAKIRWSDANHAADYSEYQIHDQLMQPKIQFILCLILMILKYSMLERVLINKSCHSTFIYNKTTIEALYVRSLIWKIKYQIK